MKFSLGYDRIDLLDSAGHAVPCAGALLATFPLRAACGLPPAVWPTMTQSSCRSASLVAHAVNRPAHRPEDRHVVVGRHQSKVRDPLKSGLSTSFRIHHAQRRAVRASEQIMGHYRIYPLNAAGRIVSGHEATCDGDQAARAVASGLLKAGEDAGVWIGARRVGRVTVGGGRGPSYAGVAAMAANDTGSYGRHQPVA